MPKDGAACDTQGASETSGVTWIQIAYDRIQRRGFSAEDSKSWRSYTGGGSPVTTHVKWAL
jgi:hypothetical protein